MSDPTQRALKLLSLLQHRPVWTGSELARRLEVTERTIRRDMQRLRELGYPVSGSAGADGGYRLEAGRVIPPLLLDEEEAAVIGVSLTLAAREGSDQLGAPALRALGKLARVMPARAAAQLDAISASVGIVETARGGAPTSTVVCVTGAIRSGNQLRFGYAGRDGTASDRRVEPQRVVVWGNRWYLFAWDLDRADWRTFRLDRVTRLRASTFTNSKRQAPPAEQYIRQSIERLRGGEAVVVDLLVDLAAASAVIPPRSGTLVEIDARRTRFETESSDHDWLLARLHASQLPFEIVGPQSLRDTARRHLERLAEALN